MLGLGIESTRGFQALLGKGREALKEPQEEEVQTNTQGLRERWRCCKLPGPREAPGVVSCYTRPHLTAALSHQKPPEARCETKPTGLAHT